jgi:hypothetical protein
MFLINEKLVNIYAPYTTADGTTFGDLTNPEVRAAVGAVECPEPPAPDDYSVDTYYRTEQSDAPYVVYTRMSDEQIKQAKAARILQEIAALESQTLLPRVTREFMLLSFAQAAAQAGVDPGANAAYAKVKELDDKIAALRSQL